MRVTIHRYASTTIFALVLIGAKAQASQEKVAFVADLPPNSPVFRKHEQPLLVIVHRNVKVGYKYHATEFFRLPFLTSTAEGEFVLYDSPFVPGTSRYTPLGTDPHTVSKKTGVPVSQLTIPWIARHPWGWYVLLATLLAGVIFGVVMVALRWLLFERKGRKKLATAEASVDDTAGRRCSFCDRGAISFCSSCSASYCSAHGGIAEGMTGSSSCCVACCFEHRVTGGIFAVIALIALVVFGLLAALNPPNLTLCLFVSLPFFLLFIKGIAMTVQKPQTIFVAGGPHSGANRRSFWWRFGQTVGRLFRWSKNGSSTRESNG